MSADKNPPPKNAGVHQGAREVFNFNPTRAEWTTLFNACATSAGIGSQTRQAPELVMEYTRLQNKIGTMLGIGVQSRSVGAGA